MRKNKLKIQSLGNVNCQTNSSCTFSKIMTIIGQCDIHRLNFIMTNEEGNRTCYMICSTNIKDPRFHSSFTFIRLLCTVSFKCVVDGLFRLSDLLILNDVGYLL